MIGPRQSISSKSLLLRAATCSRDIFPKQSFNRQLTAAIWFRTGHDELVEPELLIALKLLA